MRRPRPPPSVSVDLRKLALNPVGELLGRGRLWVAMLMNELPVLTFCCAALAMFLDVGRVRQST